MQPRFLFYRKYFEEHILFILLNSYADESVLNELMIDFWVRLPIHGYTDAMSRKVMFVKSISSMINIQRKR